MALAEIALLNGVFIKMALGYSVSLEMALKWGNLKQINKRTVEAPSEDQDHKPTAAYTRWSRRIKWDHKDRMIIG